MFYTTISEKMFYFFGYTRLSFVIGRYIHEYNNYENMNLEPNKCKLTIIITLPRGPKSISRWCFTSILSIFNW